MSIVLLGATGFTGGKTLQCLADASASGVVLLGRNPSALRDCAAKAGIACETVQCDARDCGSLASTLEPCDVVVNTAGPFSDIGVGVALAAAGAGCVYFDSTGEPPFIRRLFDEVDQTARATGATIVPALGYDFVPGHVAAYDALTRAGAPGTRVRIGYFLALTPDSNNGRVTAPSVAQHFRMLTGGTRASLTRVVGEPSFDYVRGSSQSGIRDTVSAEKLLRFTVAGQMRTAVSMGGAEHFGLPEAFPQLDSVDVGLGWFGRLTVPLFAGMQIFGSVLRSAPARSAMTRISDHLPGAHAQPSLPAKSLVVAEVRNNRYRVLTKTVVEGPDPYELTARLLSGVALAPPQPEIYRAGVHGPIVGLGAGRLSAAADASGLKIVDQL